MSGNSLTPLDRSRGMRTSILAGGFTASFTVCTAPQFLIGFATLLGARSIEIAFLTALPMLGLVCQFFSLLVTPYLHRRKPWWFWLASAHRLLWLIIALVPFFTGYISLKTALFIFLALFFINNVLGQLAAPFWFSWMADLIPKDQAGKFWARRVSVFSLLNILAIPLGIFADLFPKDDFTPYAVLFFLAGIIGQIDILIHNRVVEPKPMQASSTETLLKRIREPFQKKDFRKFLFFTSAYNFAVFFGDGFVIYFFLKQIGLSQSLIACATALMWVVRWSMARFWGFLGDRYGSASVLKVCSMALVFWPLALVFWGSAHPTWTLFGIYLYMGTFNVGFETSFLSLLLGLSPTVNKSSYVSILHTCIGIVGSIAPLLGGSVLHWLEGHPSLIQPLNEFQALFALATILRFIAVFGFSLKFQEVKDTSAALLVKRLFDSNPFKVIHYSFVLHEGVTESDRVDAVHELAVAGSSIATDQVIPALKDPSLEVRRGAVRALVEIGEKKCLPEILSAAQSPVSQIQVEAVEALGKLGDRSVTPFLLSLLNDSHLQLASLRALGFLKDPSSISSIHQLSLNPSESEIVQATAIETLCHLQDETSVSPCLQFIRKTPHDLLRWQAAVALARFTLHPLDFYSILQKELRVRGDMVLADFSSRLPIPGRRSKVFHQSVQETVTLAQKQYMEHQWRNSSLNFVYATLIHLRVATPDKNGHPIGVSVALKHLQRSIKEVSATHSQMIPSLKLAEAILKHEPSKEMPATSEEAILAYGLLRKFYLTSS